MTIDGREIEVPMGTTVLRAAKQLGIEVPVFCYHPGLSIPANCRMCLVEVEKSPKPLPACYTEVSDGMVVRTQTEKVKATQQAVLEFILLNHPVDCPICDQAGECVLQEHFVRFSAQPSRLFHEKIGKPKAKVLGPKVILDAERCILCTRCVRFCEEVTKTNELTVEMRGEHSEITLPEGKVLDNDYSLSVVDICPVGALTSREFRFQRRVWFLDQHASVCTGCARGCNIRLDSHKNQVERLVARYNGEVNRWWMCDAGRGSLAQRRDGALKMGHVPGTDGESRQAPAIDGLQTTAQWLQELKLRNGRVGIAVSASLTNEDIYAFAGLAQALGAQVFLLPRTPWTGDAVLKTADRDCNTAGAKAILDVVSPGWGDAKALTKAATQLDALVLVDSEIGVSDDLLDALESIDQLVVLTDLPGPLADAADVLIPLTWLQQRDGTLVNVDGQVQRLAAPLKPAVTTVTPHAAAAHFAHYGAGVELDLTERSRPDAIFDRIAAVVPAFAHLNYTEIGDYGRRLTHGAPLAESPARVAGTPAWEPDPVAPSFARPFQLHRGAQ